PGVAKPQSRQYVQRRRIRPTIAQVDQDQNVGRRAFRVFYKYIEISIVLKDASVQQFIFLIITAAPPIGLEQISIGVSILRVFIKILHVGVGGGAIEVKIIFFDVFPVVALAIGQAKEPLLEDRVLAIPQGKRKAQPLVVIADAR